MEDSTDRSETLCGRIRSILMVFCAVVLFLAGLLLLFAPGPALGEGSRRQPVDFPGSGNGWIMSAQSLQPISSAG